MSPTLSARRILLARPGAWASTATVWRVGRCDRVMLWLRRYSRGVTPYRCLNDWVNWLGDEYPLRSVIRAMGRSVRIRSLAAPADLRSATYWENVRPVSFLKPRDSVAGET